MKGICFLSFLRSYKSTCHFKSVVYDSRRVFFLFYCRVLPQSLSCLQGLNNVCRFLQRVHLCLMRVFIWSLEWGNFVLFNSNFRHAGAPALRGMLSICWSFNPPLLFTLKYHNCWDESTWVPCIGPPKSPLLTSTLWPHSSIDPFGLFWLDLPGLIRWIRTWRKKLDCCFGFGISSSVSRGHHAASAVMQTVLVCWCKERAKCKGKVVDLTIDLHAFPHEVTSCG